MNYIKHKEKMKTLSLLCGKIEDELRTYFSYLMQRITPLGSLWNKVLHQTECFITKKTSVLLSKNINSGKPLEK